MFPNAKPSELITLMATIDPASQAAGTVVTAFVPVKNHQTFLGIVSAGVFGASGTVDAKFRQATDASGTNAKDVAGKSIVQLVAAGGNSRQAMVNMKTGDLDTEGGFAFVALSVAVGVASSFVGASLIGTNPRFADAAALNPASVAAPV